MHARLAWVEKGFLTGDKHARTAFVGKKGFLTPTHTDFVGEKGFLTPSRTDFVGEKGFLTGGRSPHARILWAKRAS